MYNMVTIVDYTELHMWKLLREYILEICFVNMYGDRCWLDLLWWLFNNIYQYLIIMSYTWSEYNIICQLCFNFKVSMLIYFHYYCQVTLVYSWCTVAKNFQIPPHFLCYQNLCIDPKAKWPSLFLWGQIWTQLKEMASENCLSIHSALKERDQISKPSRPQGNFSIGLPSTDQKYSLMAFFHFSSLREFSMSNEFPIIF